MDKKGQIGKLVVTVPVMILVVVIMIAFVGLSYIASISNPAKILRSSEFEGNDGSTFLLKVINIESGNLQELSAKEAYEFKGKRFSEEQYRLIPIEQNSGLPSGRIYGIIDEKKKSLLLIDLIILASSQEKDFSYYRLLVEQEIEKNLEKSEGRTCLFIKTQDERGFRPFFYVNEEGNWKNNVYKKGIDTSAFVKEIDLRAYEDSFSRLNLEIDGKKLEIHSYYGECLGKGGIL